MATPPFTSAAAALKLTLAALIKDYNQKVKDINAVYAKNVQAINQAFNNAKKGLKGQPLATLNKQHTFQLQAAAQQHLQNLQSTKAWLTQNQIQAKAQAAGISSTSLGVMAAPPAVALSMPGSSIDPNYQPPPAYVPTPYAIVPPNGSFPGYYPPVDSGLSGVQPFYVSTPPPTSGAAYYPQPYYAPQQYAQPQYQPQYSPFEPVSVDASMIPSGQPDVAYYSPSPAAVAPDMNYSPELDAAVMADESSQFDIDPWSGIWGPFGAFDALVAVSGKRVRRLNNVSRRRKIRPMTAIEQFNDMPVLLDFGQWESVAGSIIQGVSSIGSAAVAAALTKPAKIQAQAPPVVRQQPKLDVSMYAIPAIAVGALALFFILKKK